MYHVLGTPQSADVTVLADPHHPKHMFGTEVTHDGRYLLITISSGTEPVNKLWWAPPPPAAAVPFAPACARPKSAASHACTRRPGLMALPPSPPLSPPPRYVDLEALPRSAGGALDFSPHDFHSGSQPLPLVKLIDDFEVGASQGAPAHHARRQGSSRRRPCPPPPRPRPAPCLLTRCPPRPPPPPFTLQAQWDYLGSEGGAITLHTNLGAPRYRVVRGDMRAAGAFAASCRDVLPQHERDLLQWCCLVKGGTLVACYLRDVAAALQLHSWSDGALLKAVPMPGIGSVGGFSGSHKHTGEGGCFEGRGPGAGLTFRLLCLAARGRELLGVPAPLVEPLPAALACRVVLRLHLFHRAGGWAAPAARTPPPALPPPSFAPLHPPRCMHPPPDPPCFPPGRAQPTAWTWPTGWRRRSPPCSAA
jgi:prolyl oligopeptidase